MDLKPIAICVLAFFIQAILAKESLESKLDSLQKYIKKFEIMQEQLEIENGKLKERVNENHKMVTSLKAMNITSVGTTYIHCKMGSNRMSVNCTACISW